MSAPREYSRIEAFAFAIAMIGVQLSSELLSQWGSYFYSPAVNTGRIVYVSIGLVAFMFMAGRFLDIFVDLGVGVWSDRLPQEPGRRRLLGIAGRRRPFIFWGSILMTFTGIAFWFPPVEGNSLVNFAFGTVVLTLHLFLYSIAYIPLLALAPEVARSQQARVSLGTWIAVGMIVGLVAAALLPGVLVTLLDPARAADDAAAGGYSAVGYQRVAIAFALVSLVCFQALVWLVRERKAEAPPEASTPALRELMNVFRLPVFRMYFAIFFLFYIGVLGEQRAIPYWVELGLGGDEATVSELGIPFMFTCLLSALACPWLSRRFNLKWLMAFALLTMALGMPLLYVIAKLPVDASLKFYLAAAAYGIKGIGLGMMYVLVTPLLGEIIDHSAALRGERQEAVFNAVHAVMVKGAQVLGIWVAAASMSQWGNSPETPDGVYLVSIICGAFCWLAFAAALFYPVLKPLGPAQKQAEDAR